MKLGVHASNNTPLPFQGLVVLLYQSLFWLPWIYIYVWTLWLKMLIRNWFWEISVSCIQHSDSGHVHPIFLPQFPFLSLFSLRTMKNLFWSHGLVECSALLERESNGKDQPKVVPHPTFLNPCGLWHSNVTQHMIKFMVYTHKFFFKWIWSQVA